jgi:sugar lactone lactonase YvrE
MASPSSYLRRAGWRPGKKETHMLRNFVFPILCLTMSSPIFAAGPARILTINPSQGPIAGGDIVTLTGTGFTATSLSLDGKAITPISASDTQITFKTPAHDNGIASVKLSGNGPNAFAEFLYLPPPLRSLAPGEVTTIMGIGKFRGDGRKATNAVVESNSINIAIDADGTVYFSEASHNVIRRVRTDGVIERYAGTGGGGAGGDGGPAIEAQLACPRGLAFDPAGNLLVADTWQVNSIRRIDRKTGIITTMIGGRTAGYSGDGGPASRAQLDDPIKIAFDGLGNLYILEGGGAAGGSFNCDHPRIRKVDTKGIITTIAGTGAVGFSGDGGPAVACTFNIGTADSGGLAADATGNVYVAETENRRVRKIDAQTGIITTIFTSQSGVLSVATDGLGYVYVASTDSTSNQILRLTSSGQLLQKWGQGWNFSEDGVAAKSAPLCEANGLAVDISGNILFGEICSNRIRRINLGSGLLETIAGMGPHIIGETGSALETTLNANIGTGLLFLPTGELLTAEASNYLIRKLDLEGNVSVFAGNGFLSWHGSPDGLAARQASIVPVELARAPNGDILIVGGPSSGLLRIDGLGIVHAVTTFSRGYAGDGGLAIQAELDEPYDVAVDSTGNVYIADTNNNRIRRIDAKTGIITTVAGSGPVNGFENYGAGRYCGDGGPATAACINTPIGIAIASDGTMYIGENAERIRRVDSSGVITTVLSGGGAKMRLGPGGNLFTIPFRVEPNGHAFRFTSMGVSAWQDAGIAIDAEGNLFYAAGDRILAVRFGAVIAEAGSTVAATAGTPQTVMTETSFPVALQTTLMSPVGTPENGIRVDFSAPASGASCTFPNGSTSFSALTDTSGHASVVCTANSEQGSYNVRATPLSLSTSASFSLTNSAPVPRASLDFNLTAGGAATAATIGIGQTVETGYASVGIKSGTTPYGTAVFKFKQNRVTVSEVGVPVSPPTTSARIFIDYRSAAAVPGRPGAGPVNVDTGIAAVNYGSASANVTYTLRDVGGVTVLIGHGILAAGGHFAKFVGQLKDVAPDFVLPVSFPISTRFASLEISSDQALSILALRMTTNQRNEVIFTTTPTADLTKPAGGGVIFFPQFADGGGYATTLVLLNTSEGIETGTLQLLDDNGDPFVVNQVGGTTGSVFGYSIPSGGVVRFQTDGSAATTKAGWAQLTPDAGTSTPVGAGVFSYHPGNFLMTESGVSAASSTTHARIYVDLSEGHNTGLAIANPASTNADVTIAAFRTDGVTGTGTSQGPLQVPANGHKARFADEFVAGLPDGFTGVLDIISSTPFAALTMRSLSNERNDFLLATFPVADMTVSAPSPIVFPQIADGGGYVTQIILIGVGGASSLSVNAYGENGGPLAVMK